MSITHLVNQSVNFFFQSYCHKTTNTNTAHTHTTHTKKIFISIKQIPMNKLNKCIEIKVHDKYHVKDWPSVIIHIWTAGQGNSERGLLFVSERWAPKVFCHRWAHVQHMLQAVAS